MIITKHIMRNPSEKIMKNNNFYKIITLLFAFLGLAFWLLFFRINASASQAQDYFPMYQNNNGHFSEELKQNIANRFDSTNNYVFVYYQYFNPNSGYGRYYYYYLAFPKSAHGMWYGEKYTNLEQWSLYSVGQTNFLQGGFYCDRRTPNTIEGVTSSVNVGQWMQGLYSSNYDNSIDYVSNFQIYTDNTSAKQIVLLYDDGVSIPDGDTAREDTPKPNINDYLPDWTNAPSFDNSSVENALNSVFNGVLWLGNNIKDSITGLGGYIVDSVLWGLQRIINTIRDKIDEIKTAISNAITSINGVLTSIGNSIASFKQSFENLKTTLEDFADLFIHPFDEEEFAEQMEDCELINQYNELIENCETIQQIFDYAEERDHFSIYIDFENPFADSEHKIIHSQISFDWLYPLRSVYRPFLWVFTLFECFVGGMRILGNIIGGKAK